MASDSSNAPSEPSRPGKMTSRAAVMVGALGVLIIVVLFAFMLLGCLCPYVWFSSHFIDALLIGPIFMLTMSKIRKPGAFVIIAIVSGLVFRASMWITLATGIIGGALCEVLLKRANCRPGVEALDCCGMSATK